ncbi:MAG: hypothetical protein ABDH23_02520 [Endomicrobiia bacterium]
MIKKIILIVLCFAIVFKSFRLDLYASDIKNKATIDAIRDAESDVKKPLWLLVGAIGGPVGVAFSYFHKDYPSATRLIGKPPEYVLTYLEVYRKTTKKLKLKAAVAGSIIALITYFYLNNISALNTGCFNTSPECSSTCAGCSSSSIDTGCSSVEGWSNTGCSSGSSGCSSGTSGGSGGCASSGGSSGCAYIGF